MVNLLQWLEIIAISMISSFLVKADPRDLFGKFHVTIRCQVLLILVESLRYLFFIIKRDQ